MKRKPRPGGKGTARQAAPRVGKAVRPSASVSDLLFEIGTEEIPARFLPPARKQLKALAEKFLREAALSFSEIESYATPRRLVLQVKGIPAVQETREITVLGPYKSQGYDAAGKPTPAAEGFARKHGVPVAKLAEVPGDKGVRLAYVSVNKGHPAGAVLPGILAKVVAGLEFPKSMRWPQSPTAFARPVRWLLAILGARPVKLEAMGIAASARTHGRRFVHPVPLPVRSAFEYFKVVKKAGIVLDVAERKARIRWAADKLAVSAGGRVLWDEDLLDEVADLVEAPAAILGSFPSGALEIPQPVLVAAMQEHQRYFPVADGSGKLLPHFVAIANGVATKAVVAGNERVLKARLADARYFYNEDMKKGFGIWVRALKNVVWQAGAGNMFMKSDRIRTLAIHLGDSLGVKVARIAWIAQICKADLVTAMVGEFPDLQGIAGGLYVRAGKLGEVAAGWSPADREEVAAAVSEHYRPAGPGDDVPATPGGALVALADKADSLAGHLALGHVPSGTRDEYGLRRAGIGIIRIIADRGWRVSLGDLFKRSVQAYLQHSIEIADAPGVIRGSVGFLRGRLAAIFAEQGFQHDEIQAALADFDDVTLAAARLKAIAELRHREGFREAMFALSRVTNILPAGFSAGNVDPAELDAEERALYDAHAAIREQAMMLAREMKFTELYDLLATLKPAIDRFFDRVMVMDKDEAVKERRLSLLARVAGSIRFFGDVKQLVIA
jgi:glycyl-tRNA synthetase beta chain